MPRRRVCFMALKPYSTTCAPVRCSALAITQPTMSSLISLPACLRMSVRCKDGVRIKCGRTAQRATKALADLDASPINSTTCFHDGMKAPAEVAPHNHHSCQVLTWKKPRPKRKRLNMIPVVMSPRWFDNASCVAQRAPSFVPFPQSAYWNSRSMPQREGCVVVQGDDCVGDVAQALAVALAQQPIPAAAG